MSNTPKDMVKDRFEVLCADLDKFLEQYPMVVSTAAKVGQRRSHLVLAVVGLVTAFIAFGYGPPALAMLVGVMYPTYASFKALQSPEPEDDTRWLTYWILLAVLNTIESLSTALTSRIPFYFFFKLGFLIWCFMPSTNGAQRIYKIAIEPVLNYFEKDIDEALSDVKKRGEEIGNEVEQEFKADVMRQGVKIAAAVQK